MSGGTVSLFGREPASLKQAKWTWQFARDVGVVLGVRLPGVTLEAELVAVVVEHAADVVDEEDRRVRTDRGLSRRTQSGRRDSRGRSATDRRTVRRRRAGRGSRPVS